LEEFASDLLQAWQTQGNLGRPPVDNLWRSLLWSCYETPRKSATNVGSLW
jgi:hypothetical protein